MNMGSRRASIAPWMMIVVGSAIPACGGGGYEARYSSTDPGPLFDGGQDFSALDQYLDGQLGKALSGFAMQVTDAQGRVVYRRESGQCTSSMCPAGDPDYTLQLVTSVASSSKWVTSTVVLAALDEGVAKGKWPSVSAALDTKVSPDLGCGSVTGPAADITMRHLLSFTSGLLYEHDCIKSESLQACACDIVKDSMSAMTTDTSSTTKKTKAHPPGTTYKYGASHHTVAGAWLEKTFGESWNKLFDRFVRVPLGVDIMEYTSAANLAGSMHTSVADYTRFVDALRADAQGTGPRRLLSKEAVLEQRAGQATNADPSLKWLITSQPGFDYGLNVWRWCARTFTEAEALGSVDELMGLIDPACDEVFIYGHAGKGGYGPFIDASGRYGAVFAMREDSPGAGETYTANEVGITAQVRLLVHLAMTK